MCLLPTSLVVPEPSPPQVPNDIQTFFDLQGFSQLYDDELEIDHKIDPDLPLSQPKAKHHHYDANTEEAQNGEMTTLEVGRPTGKESNMAAKEMVGNGATCLISSCVLFYAEDRLA